jgi:predicted P-loop ATPase
MMQRIHIRPDWIDDCILSEKGNPLPILANAMTGLRSDPALKDAVGYDEFACSPVLLHPVGNPNMVHHTPPKLTDKNISDIQVFLQQAGIRSLSKDCTHQAIHSYARENGFHPVRDYFSSLDWDGIPRLGEWLATYAGAELSDYTGQIGQMFMIEMVARVYRPGCKADYMLVLEGPQGKIKSTLLNVLTSPWFSDALPDISSKDASIHLRGRLLIEVAELHAFSKADALLLKSFLTRREEQFRPPFGREEVVEPRQCVFAGTTNREAYLQDETGNRRFWPFKCVGKIDPDAVARDRNQLFAEAIDLYRHKARWWPDEAFEQKIIKPHQDARYEPDAWEDYVVAYLKTVHKTTVMQTAVESLGYGDKRDRLGTREQRRIANIFKVRGWVPGRRGPNGERFFVPGPDWKPSDALPDASELPLAKSMT